MIKVFQAAYPGVPLIFIAEEGHSGHVKAKLADAAVQTEFRTAEIIKSTAGGLKKILQWVDKLRKDYRFMNAVVKEGRDRNAVIYFCSVPPISLRFLTMASRKYPEVKIINTLHGELELVFEHHGKKEEMIGNMYRSLFAKTQPNLYHLLLNKIAKQPVLDLGLLKEESILDITHPYFYQSWEKKESVSRDTLKLGHVGSLGIRKNGQLLFDLAARFKTLIADQKVSFSAVGAIEPNIVAYKNESVQCFTDKHEGYLDRRIFEQKIQELDYALFFYGPGQFIFRASGAIFDVIEHCKPVIVLRHPYFEYLFREAGNIGFMCDSLDEMEALILRLINKDDDLINQYTIQQHNITAYRSAVDIPNIAKDFKQQLSERSIM